MAYGLSLLYGVPAVSFKQMDQLQTVLPVVCSVHF